MSYSDSMSLRTSPQIGKNLLRSCLNQLWSRQVGQLSLPLSILMRNQLRSRSFWRKSWRKRTKTRNRTLCLRLLKDQAKPKLITNFWMIWLSGCWKTVWIPPKWTSIDFPPSHPPPIRAPREARTSSTWCSRMSLSQSRRRSRKGSKSSMIFDFNCFILAAVD